MSLPSSQITQRVMDVVRSQMSEPQSVGAESKLVDDLQLDSVDLVEIQIALEEEFSNELQGRDIDDAFQKAITNRDATIQSLVDFMNAQIAA